MGFDLGKEKILCLIVVDDEVSKTMRGQFIPAYLRAFILQNRESGKIYATYRFKQADGSRKWVELYEDGKTADGYREAIEAIFRFTMKASGYEGDEPVSCFYPPENLSPMESLKWMEKMDLIEVTKVEKVPE